MTRKTAPEPTGSLSIGPEAQQLLALLAEKSGSSPSAVLESAIREKAQRERVTSPGQPIGNGTEAESLAGSAIVGSIPLDLRLLAARAVDGDTGARGEMGRVIAQLRAETTITPAKRPEELDPGWQDRFLALVEQLGRAVPEEWTAEELEEQIAQAIAEVRAGRAGDH
ncbi:MAG: hypothetical protein ACR2PL_02125 [Dehalococcoidia bacterium]